ncbi:carbamoyltransferase HypF, partial [bacterium]|nr:carbamoyltransferase HypF [bacterium]MBU1638448.1 carbamoyltransferase HypF [bacterium]
AIWGGELLIGNALSFKRFAHLDYVSMPGGERAAREPWRMAVAWLNKSFGGINDELYEFLRRRWKHAIQREQLDLLLDSYLMTTVYPLTSSTGRLFDAVAALVYFGSEEQFEGQAAMGLEWLIDSAALSPYPLDIRDNEGTLNLDPQQMFREIIADLMAGKPASEVSRRFHETVVEGFARVCDAARIVTGIETVALSGGCFQNTFLLTRFSQVLRARGFRVLTHSQIPCNDGGVSLGQACVAHAQEV